MTIEKTGGAANRIIARAVKDDTTGWIFFEASLQAIEGESLIGGMIQYSPKKGGSTEAEDFVYLTTPQFEDGACASSFIITTTTPGTRASDLVKIPLMNNLYNLPFTALAEAHKNWYKSPNAAPRVFDSEGHQSGAAFICGFGSATENDGYPYCDIGGSNRRIPANASLDKMVMGMRCKEDGMVAAISNGTISSESKTTWKYIRSSAFLRIGGQTATGLRHLFGHVRNLRIWHKALTDAQLRESV